MGKMSAQDPEQAIDTEKVENISSGYSPIVSVRGTIHQAKPSRFRNFVDSFKPPLNSSMIPTNGGDVETSAEQDHEDCKQQPQEKLSRRLKHRHLQFIAIASCVGTGLFVGSGSALAQGGPASLLIAFGLIGMMMICTVNALGELGVMYPVAGSFSAFSTRFLDPAWGFAMGWNYAISWLTTFPLELTAASMTISFWPGGRNISGAAWVAIYWVFVVSINLIGVEGFGEAEFVFSTIKVIGVIGFIIFGISVNCGGSPNQDYIGGRYWQDPGAFNNGFKGLCSVFVTASFAFGGTEMVGLVAAETANPRRSLPAAVKQVFWRVILFYVVALLMVGLLVPYTDPRLINGSGSSDANASPFVIAIRNAGVGVLPSIFNVVIMISILSVGNSAVYGASRTIAAMADQGQAPKILGYVDRKGRPTAAILFTSVFGLIAFVAGAGSDTREAVFDWLMAIAGLAQIFNWGSICLAHIRFRRAWKVQGRSLSDLPYRSQLGTWGSWTGFIFNCLVVIAQFWTGFAPVGYESMTAGERTKSWFQSCLSLLIIIITYSGFKLWNKTKAWRAENIDLVSGQRLLNVTHIIEEERMERQSWSTWKRIRKFFC